MIRIIDGKKYNTETAKKVASDESNLGQSDFKYYTEKLYITKKGSWFLAGEGHGMTKYAHDCGGSSGYGSAIFPLQPKKAQEWLEKNDFIDEVEQYFSDQIEDA